MEDLIDVLKIVHLVCDNQKSMFERLRRRALKENRYDDADEKVIRHRWEVYEQESAPVMSHYDSSLIAEINSIGSPAEVLYQTLEIVVPIQNQHFSAFRG